MSVIARLNFQKSLEVCHICVEYLVTKCLREKGLFRNPPSVVEIRKLRTHMLDERQAKALRDTVLDPHLVAGVLQLTLKDMPVSVYNRIYDDMMGTSSESADFSRNKSDVIQWMCKFDAESFNFLKTLMAFMHQLGTTAGNDANISQLVFIFAPLICRPTNSAYMSVRHMEDLRKLRPTLQVIVENYLEIFNAARPCATVDSKDQRGSHIRPLISDMDSYTTDICRSSSSDQVAYSPTQESMISGAESELESNYRQKKLALNLQVSLPPAPTTDVNDSNLSAVTVRQINFQSKEWNRLEQMVFAMSESFLRQPFQFFNPSNASTENDSGMVMSNENDLMACTIETFEVGNVGFGGGDIDSPTRDRDLGDFDDGRYWTQGGSLGTGELFSKSGRAPMSPSSIIGGSNGAAFRASSRRRMVHECRTLRQHITKFEKDFSLVHNRLPKGGDKGHMLPVYSKYRDMKREIRSSAAVDIQRIVRAFLCRSKLRKTKRMIPVSPSRFIRSPIRPSSSPGRTSNLIHELGSPPRPDSTALSRGNFDQNPVESNLWKSNVKGSNDSGDFMDSGGSDDADGQFLYAKYKDLLLQKRTLKRRLKRFDEEFAAKYNRQPKKTDKEVMRPHYQKYHEVRNEMQSLRLTIERVMGSLPLELQEVAEGEQPLNRPISEPSSDSGGRMTRGDRMEHSSSNPTLPTINGLENHGGGEEDDELMARYESQNHHHSGDGRSNVHSDIGAPNGQSAGWLSASPSGTDISRSSISTTTSSGPSIPVSSGVDISGWSRASSNSPAEIEALQKEKRQLHIVLKAYERDFNQIHGRHVMKPEDIAPVAGEYQRYKELKKKLKDM